MIWGLTWIAIKFQLEAGDPNVSIFYRFLVSTLIMFGLAAYKKERFHYSFYEHRLMLMQGFSMFSLNFMLTYWASGMAPSALISLAFTGLIFLNMFGGFLFLKLPINKKVIFGALISFSGMALIAYNEAQVHEIEKYPLSYVGFFISLLATVSASAGNLVSTKNRQLNLPIISNTAYGMMYGSIFTLIYCLIMGKNFHLNITPLFAWSFLYLTLFGTVISFISYLKLIQIVGPSRAAFTSVVSPIIALVISTYFEGMTWSLLLGLGIGLSLIGNVIALVEFKTRAHGELK